jgi:SAM-dependent methyltransferase
VGGSVIAADQSPGMIEVLRQKIAVQKISKVFPFVGSVDAVIAKGAQLFGGRFDLIVCSSVCAFLDDYLDVVKKLAASLSPGGAFVQWDWEYEPRSPEPFGLTRLQIEEALTGAGLTRVEVGEGFNVEFEGMRIRPLRGVGFR